MTTCRTGMEICVYESNRIQILSIIDWSKGRLNLKNISGRLVDVSVFDFLEINQKNKCNHFFKSNDGKCKYC